MMNLGRRRFLATGAAAGMLTANAVAARAARTTRSFPKGFLWGTATAGHQVEGNNSNSDTWALEHITPSAFREPSGDACDSFHRWPLDLDIVRNLGLNTYRFSLEWARIEPVPGQFSVAMLDHYKAMIDGCLARGMKPVVTFNHFTCPRWFAMMGGWTNPDAAKLFARYCERAAKHLGDGIQSAITLNEPNLMRMLRFKLPPIVFANNDAVMAAAAKAYNSTAFVSQFIENEAQTDAMLPIMINAHRMGKAAIKSVRSNLPVGVSLAIEDDQAIGPNSRRDAKRLDCYAPWLEVARDDDFVGVQNYERARINSEGQMPVADDAPKSTLGAEIYPASLSGAVRYAWDVARVPVLVSEHGIGTADDTHRAAFIPAALTHLRDVMDDGVPVIGYIHWSLLDNFEWVFGYGPKFGLCGVDRKTFRRTPKPSATVFAKIAKRNGL